MKNKRRNIGVILICLFIILLCIIFRSTTIRLDGGDETQTEEEVSVVEAPPSTMTVEPDSQPANAQTESSQETEPPAEAEPQEVEPPQEEEPVQETEPQMTYLGQYRVTGYDICVKCCGKTDGITASGTIATVGRTVGCNSLPFGTRLYIDGIGERIVEDRGGTKSNILDVLCNNHDECYAITGYYDVYIIND